MRPVMSAVCASSLFFVAGCASSPPPPEAPSAPIVATPKEPGSGETLPEVAPVAAQADGSSSDSGRDATPRVVRRLVAETRDLVSRSDALARELPDPDGRARSRAEVDELARELTEIEAVLGQADSAALDKLVATIFRLDTKVSLLHERLRGATNRTSAVLIE